MLVRIPDHTDAAGNIFVGCWLESDDEPREALELTRDDLLKKFAEGRPAFLPRSTRLVAESDSSTEGASDDR